MLPAEDVTLQLTVSIGVATLTGKTDEVEAMVARADKALYEAKNSGRNRVFASHSLSINAHKKRRAKRLFCY